MAELWVSTGAIWWDMLLAEALVIFCGLLLLRMLPFYLLFHLPTRICDCCFFLETSVVKVKL